MSYEKSCRQTKHRFCVPQVLIACAILSACDNSSVTSAPSVPSSQPAPPALIAEGSEAYSMYCAICHLAGEASGRNPALINSAVVSGPPAGTIQVILNGQSNISMVEGKPLGGIMPAQAYLTDEEIAAIVTYIRAEFAGINETVTPATVKSLRTNSR